MIWLLLIPLGLVALFFLGLVLARMGGQGFPIRVLLHGVSRPHAVTLHYRSWLPKLFDGYGLTVGHHIWLRGEKPTGKAQPDTIQRWQVGHELFHVVQWVQEDDVRFALKGIWQHLTQKWGKRSVEIEAQHWQTEIAAGTCPFLEAPWLPLEFPSNRDEPANT